METAGACFERCPGQAPAEMLALGQLEASAFILSHKAQSSRVFSEFERAGGVGANTGENRGVVGHCFGEIAPRPWFRHECRICR